MNIGGYDICDDYGIAICRAILERFPDEILGDSPLTAIGGRRKAQFAGDQSIANGICRMMAFRFRLEKWIGEYEVVEVGDFAIRDPADNCGLSFCNFVIFAGLAAEFRVLPRAQR